MYSLPIVLTIAGSDSGGGAGIQADIKAISATGGYACSALTALTAQNTRGVSAVQPVPVEFIRRQLEAVFTDFDVAAVKIGMLGDAATIEAVAETLRETRPRHVVVDPVMVTRNGDMLLPESAIRQLKEQLLPLADIMTPNLPEAMALCGKARDNYPRGETQLAALANALFEGHPLACLVKGGHQQGPRSTDVLAYSGGIKQFPAPRIATLNTHGAGCTLSAAIACYLARGEELAGAVGHAKQYLTAAINAGRNLQIGHGAGPVHHFYNLHIPDLHTDGSE